MIKRVISMFLILCMLSSIVPVQAFTDEPEITSQQTQNISNPFNDVSESDWYYDSVMYALKNGLLTGTSDNTFSPDGTMTRAMFVTLLGRMAKIDSAKYVNGTTFTDVPSGSYYEPYVQWAVEKGITSGVGNGKFDPNGLVTREQIATLLVRFFDAYNITYPEAMITTVPNDIDSVAGWAKDAVLKLWACGLFVGNNGNFNPGNYAKRSEAAALCQRINEVVEKWLVETGANTDPGDQENPPVPHKNDSSGGGGDKKTSYYKVDFKSPEGLTGATMPEGKLYPSGTTISSLPTPFKENTVFLGWYYDENLTAPAAASDKITKNLSLYAKFADGSNSHMVLETPNYLTVVDVDTDFTFQVKAPSAQVVKSSLTIKNITANNKEMDYTVSGESSPFTVTAVYEPGETYKAELAEGSDTAFVYNGEQSESIRVFNFITKMDEVLNLSLSGELKYIPKNQVSNITGKAFDGLLSLSITNGTLSANKTDDGGTFTYSGGDIAVGDTVAIYSGIRPDQRDLTTTGSAKDGDVAYVIITAINGNTYSYTPADSKNVLFTPDVLPIPKSADTDGNPNNNSVTVASNMVDFSDDKYSSLKLDSQTTVDIGDFIALYTGDFGGTSGMVSYGKVTNVRRNQDLFIIDYEIVTLEEVYASMDIYHTRNEEIELTDAEIKKIERDIEKQAESSGFVKEATNYLTKVAINTDGFRELSEDMNLKSLSIDGREGHKLSALSEDRTELKNLEVDAHVRAGKVLQHFDGSYGVRVELSVNFTFEIETKTGSGEKLEINVQALFEQEVLISVNVSGGAIWKKAWIFPYIYDYQLNTNVDVGTFTGIGITATAKTSKPDDSIGYNWKPASGTKVEEKIIDIGQQIMELIEEKETFLGEKLVDAYGEEWEWSGTHGGGLAEKYAAMIEEADDSWIELLKIEIFSVEGSVDPFHILVFGIGADFVVSANMYVTMGCTFEYGNAKRYNFSLMLFHKKSTNETIDLEPAHYQFDFYVMGTMGVRAGIEFELAVGLFSLKLDSIGITAEAGVYAQMWGYFYSHYRREKGERGAPGTRESKEAGAFLLEIGAYLQINFKAQLFSNEKLTYEPTIFDKTWPFLTIGSAENIIDFSYKRKETPRFDIKTVKSFTLPTSLFEMQYMDLQTGEFYGGEDADDDHPAKNYDDKTESYFIIEISNEAFHYDPATNTVTVVPDENSTEEYGEMKIIWKEDSLAFTSMPIYRIVEFLWRDLEEGRYIAFDSIGGSPVDMVFAKEGVPITKPENPKKQGYDFAGWYMDKAGNIAFEFPSTMPKYPEPEKGITVYAKWTPALNTYKVEHYFQELNGKFTLNPALTQIKRDQRTGEMTAAEAYSISGYTAKPVSQAMVAATGSTVVKIYYERNRYTLRFSYGEFAGEENPDLVYSYRYGMDIFEPKLALGGYIFDGWDSKISGSMPPRDVTYTAKWKPDPNTPYRVEHYFQNVSGSGYTYVSMENKSGETASTVDCASLAQAAEGMTYSHATVEGREATSVKIKADGTSVIKLYYDRNTYDVTFDTKEGSEVPKLTGIRYGAAVGRPADPAKPGYSFGGWYKDEDCSDGNAFDFSLDKMPGENLTLYAKWVAGSYRVIFDANGGSGTTPSQNFTYDVEEALTANGFTRPGYTFAGWNTKKDGSGDSYTVGQAVSGLTTGLEIVLYAQWDLNSYTVRFHANDGTGTIAEQTFHYDEMKALSANSFSRPGYSFAGWAESADGNIKYTDTQKVKNLSIENKAIVHLYAKWTANTYTVIFDRNGEDVTGNMANQSFTYDESLKPLTTNKFTRTGYSFVGWNTNADGSGDFYSDGKEVRNLITEGNIVLYAIWQGNTYTITLNDEGGTGGSGSISATYGSDLSAVNIPEKTGYEFKGYYDGQNGTGNCYYSADGDGVGTWNKANDTTLYAYWTPRSFTLTFHANEGTVTPQSKPVTFGETFGDLPVPTRNGYTFAGWFTGTDGGYKVDSKTTVSIAEDQDIYAHWAANTYTVVFHGNGADAGTMANQRFTYDEEKKTLTANSYTRTGYTFDGWATSSTSVKVYDDKAFVGNLTTEKDGQYNLYAVWKANTYIVLFHGNGAETGTMGDQSFTYGTPKALNANAFKKAGYIFEGWAASAEGEVVYSDRQSINLVTEDGAIVDLYAKWTAGHSTPYKVEHYQQDVDGDGYTLESTQNLAGTTGAPTTAKANSYPGFIAKPFNQGTIAGDGSTVVKVYYDREVNDAIWMDNETVISKVSYRYDKAIVAPAEPKKDGFYFKGWTWEGNNTPVKTIPQTVKMGTTDITFTANWSPITYVVTFNTKGGSPIPSQTIGYNGKVTEPDNPTRDGYTFKGWFKDETCNVPYDFDEVVYDSHIIYAKWEVITYTITFESKGGSDVQEQIVEHGKPAERPADPKKEGFNFIGWYIDDECRTEYVFTEPVTSDHTLYAGWKIRTYTVTFESKGGSDVQEQIVEHGRLAERPADPTKEGYTFVGWYFDVGCLTECDFTEPVTSDHTLYAKWDAISYQVEFDGNGNTGGFMEAQTFTYDIPQRLFTNGFTKTGYTFDGWNTMIDGTGDKYEDGDYVPNLSAQNGATVTLYAQWKANKYTVYFDGNASTGGYMEAQIFTYDIKQNLSANGFTKIGHSFIGWNTDKEGNGDSYAPGAELFNLFSEDGASMTLYAQWKREKYTITFMYDSNTEYLTIEEDYKTPIIALADPEREGYTFEGWSRDIPATMPAENLTIIAQWTAIKYPIEYDLDGGNDPGNPTTYTIEDVVKLIPPTKDDYIFVGWTEGDSTEITKDVTIEKGNIGPRKYKAHWQEKSYFVKVVGKNGVDYVLEGKRGEEITLSTTLTKGTVTVLAWFNDADFQNEISTYTVAGTENETIYAWLYSSSEPCLIQTAKDLLLLRDRVNNNSNGGRWRSGNYKLGYKDDTPVTIKLNGMEMKSWIEGEDGIGLERISGYKRLFTGTFDGNSSNGSYIEFGSAFYNSQNNYSDIPLFGAVGSGGTVKNVDVRGRFRNVEPGFGGIAGINHGKIENCIFNGEILFVGGNWIGGIVGENYGTIEDCTLGENTSINVSQFWTTKYDYVGGIAGYNYDGGEIIGNNTTISGLEITYGRNYIGGIVGYNKGHVSGWIIEDSKIEGYYYIGGIVGNNESYVEDCELVDSSVDGIQPVGGIAGYNSDTLLSCKVKYKREGSESTVHGHYETGGIAGKHVAGGLISQCTVSDAYITASWNQIGGLVGAMMGNAKISDSSVENTEITAGNWYAGGIAGWASVQDSPVMYEVSNITIENTVIKVEEANRNYAGEFIGNYVEFEARSGYTQEITEWIINSTVDVEVITY